MKTGVEWIDATRLFIVCPPAGACVGFDMLLASAYVAVNEDHGSKVERLSVAGALIAAEIDRLQEQANRSNEE